jgi:hypothetical protein
VAAASAALAAGGDAANPFFKHKVVEKTVFVARTPTPKDPMEVGGARLERASLPD